MGSPRRSCCSGRSSPSAAAPAGSAGGCSPTRSTPRSPASPSARRWAGWHGHELNARVHHGAEQVEKFLELAAILLLGSLLSSAGLGWSGWALALVLLVVIRPAAALLSLLGSKVEGRSDRAFVAWFGVRGVGTLCDRRPRAALGQAATRSSAGDASRSLTRSSTASSTARWWIGSSPGPSVSPSSSSVGRMISPDW
jgi:hypothetical protein